MNIYPNEPEVKLVKIGDAADFLHVSTQTLRGWTEQGKIPAVVTSGGHRMYAEKDLFRLKHELRGIEGYWSLGAVMMVDLNEKDELIFSEPTQVEVSYVPFSRYWDFRNVLGRTVAKVVVEGSNIIECSAVQPGGGSLMVFLGMDSVDKEGLDSLLGQAVQEAKVWVKDKCVPVRTVVWKSLEGREIPLDGY